MKRVTWPQLGHIFGSGRCDSGKALVDEPYRWEFLKSMKAAALWSVVVKKALAGAA